MKVLELFAGSRSISEAFEIRGHETFSVEWNKDFENIDLYEDINNIKAEDILEKFGRPDVIWASPDCTTYSIAAISHHRKKNKESGNLDSISDYAKFCDKTNKHVLNLIRELNPKFYFIENPRGGLRKMDFMKNLPRYTVTYCQYGDKRMKPTDIWTNHPNPRFKPMCKNGASCHEKAPRGSRTGTQGLKGSKERSIIPQKLCQHIAEICESAILKKMTTYHCFFEQSGTFKNEFRKLGYNAYDYDIKNDFNETDFKIDLFQEIEKAYDNKKSIFDSILKKDMILAFFPCIRFEDQIQMHFRGTSYQYKNYTEEQKLEKDLELHKELSSLYNLITKLAIVCIRKKISLIIENPYSSTHYLVKYWALPYTLLDEDRRKMGDYFEKPTQYWFINCKPKNNLIFEPIQYVKQKSCNYVTKEDGKDRTVMRSMIHPQYANRFIREFILEEWLYE